MDINAVCEKYEQAEALKDMGTIAHIFHPGNTMPYVFRNEDAKLCGKMLSEPEILVRSIDGMGYLKENGYEGTICADHTIYSCNTGAADTVKALGADFDCAPLELSHHELKSRGLDRSELMIYGRIPMMISAGCIYRNVNDDTCRKDVERGHDMLLIDRTDTGFPVICCCRYCYNVIFNSVPLSLHRELDRVRELAPHSVRLYFTTESADEARDIAAYFVQAINEGKAGNPPYEAYTRGHFLKSVV